MTQFVDLSCHMFNLHANITTKSLDLQARISAELGMLQNEQIKLQVLYQAMQAQESSLRQQASERAIAGQGNFATRFQPTP